MVVVYRSWTCQNAGCRDGDKRSVIWSRVGCHPRTWRLPRGSGGIYASITYYRCLRSSSSCGAGGGVFSNLRVVILWRYHRCLYTPSKYLSRPDLRLHTNLWEYHSNNLNTYKQHIAKTPEASQLSLSTGSTLAEVRTAAHILETWATRNHTSPWLQVKSSDQKSSWWLGSKVLFRELQRTSKCRHTISHEVNREYSDSDGIDRILEAITEDRHSHEFLKAQDRPWTKFILWYHTDQALHKPSIDRLDSGFRELPFPNLECDFISRSLFSYHPTVEWCSSRM